jgi:membrane fusion protein, multidrug efflux system
MPTDQPNGFRKRLPLLIALLVAGVGGYFAYQAYRHGQQYETTDNAQIEGNSAPVLARVAGYVQSVDVTDYSVVKRGQPLLTIDGQEFDVALRQAEADYQQSVADLRTARADLQNARANRLNVVQNARVAQSNADVQAVRREKARQDLQRDQNLFRDQSLTQKQLADSRSNVEVQARQFEANVEQVALAKSSQGVAQAGIDRATAAIGRYQAVLKVKQAVIDNARLRLGYARITAPIGGKIGRKNVVVGQYVQPGQALMTIVADSTFWVIANVKETQLRRMNPGQEAEIKLDAYPDLKIKGRVSSFSDATGSRFALLPPDNSSGNFVKITQRVPVRIDIDRTPALAGKLRAGLSAEVEIRVGE